MDTSSLLKASATASKEELIAALHYLSTENTVLRNHHDKRIKPTQSEKRQLSQLAKALPRSLEGTIAIAKPETVRRWGSKAKREAKLRMKKRRTDEEIQELILEMAEKNGWGVTRIHGNLRKLGLGQRVTRSTVRNILRENGYDPYPDRGRGSWHDFVKRHKDCAWSTDFFTCTVRTKDGKTHDCYALFFLHIGTRRVYFAGATFHPNRYWVAQHARNFCMQLTERDPPTKFLICDNDTKYCAMSDAVFAGEAIRVVRTCKRVPVMNAFAESFVRSIKREAMDHFLYASPEQVANVARTFVRYYNAKRPHRGLENRPIGSEADPVEMDERFGLDDVLCTEELGGLLRDYVWKEAA